MKKLYLILIIIVVLIIGWFVIRFVIGGNEDDWIKNEKGQWAKHGYPVETPDYVVEQQDAIICALWLYEQAKSEGIELNSQCLGSCDDYAVDIVNVPRNENDNKVENQCEYYKNKIVSHFIELDKNGEIIRIV